MKAKEILKYHLLAIDRYRDDPNKQNKDNLLEAEMEARERVGMPTEYLPEYYRNNR